MGFQEPSGPVLDARSQLPISDEVMEFRSEQMAGDNTFPKAPDVRSPNDTLPREPPPALPTVPLPIAPPRTKGKFLRYLIPEGLTSTRALTRESFSPSSDPANEVVELTTFK